MQNFDSLGIVEEAKTLTVGLKRLLGTATVLTDGDVTVTAAVYDKSAQPDASPSDILIGSAQVNDAPVVIKGVTVPIGQAVLQSIDPSQGVVGCTYVLTFKWSSDGEKPAEQALVEIIKYVPKD